MTQNFPRLSPKLKSPETENDTIDLGALFGTLWRGKWLIAFITTIAIALGGYYAFFVATPLYTSSAVVMLETQQEQIIDLQSVMGGLSGDTSAVNSEVEVLRSRGLMQKVVNRLNLTEDPEFNAELRDASVIDTVKDTAKAYLGLAKNTDILPPELARQRTLDGTVETLLEAVSIRNIPLSLVFQVTVKTEDPLKSAQIADTIVDLYVLNQLEVKFEATEQATEWLTERVAELKIELQNSEARVADFNSETNLISIEVLQAQERQMKDLRERIASRAEILQADEAKLARLRAVAEADRAAKAAASGDAELIRLAGQIADGEENTATTRAFDSRFAQLLMRSETDAARSRSQLTALEQSAEALQAETARQSDDLIALQQLTREAEASRLLYEYFLGRLKETAAQQGIQQADSRVLSNAVVPVNPSEPRKSLLLATSGLLGMMIGAGLVLLLEARQNTFRTARELESFTGYNVMGQIPLLPTRRRRDTLKYLAERPTSAAAEAVRNLRTSVLLSNVDKPPQVILTTSSLPGEGKTTLSLALAQNLTGLGKKVLIIEGDIRRRVFGHYLNTKQTEGLLSVLSGDARLEDVVLKDDRIKADILIGEESKVNAADLFASDKFKAFMADLRKRYDIIIIDTPPVLVVPDARLIAQACDAILFAVKWDATSKAQVEEALRMFESVGQHVTGLVLGQVSPKGMRRYGHGGKYGAYSAYGAKYYTN